jgi:ATP-binding cassette subfamily B protein
MAVSMLAFRTAAEELLGAVTDEQRADRRACDESSEVHGLVLPGPGVRTLGKRMRTFWRLLGFLRPYRGGVLVSFALAAGAMGAGVLIPYLVGHTIDEIRGGSVDLWPLAGAVAAAGVLRLGFSVSRRLVAGRVSLGVEYDLRNRMYEHLHSLELGFFDMQQTGQLMSRATVDLQSVRFFLGYGLIFILQSALTILIAAGVMLAVAPGLALVALAPMPFVIWISFRYGRRNRPASQEVQQRIAELTAEAEENIGGVRVVKAFAQEERQLRRFRHAVKRVFDQSMVSTRLRAFYSPFIGFLPQLGLAGVLFVGGRQAINNQITIGEFVAFYGYVLLLTSPMRMLGIALGMAQRAVASGQRVFELLDREPRLTAPPGAPPLPPGDGRVELRDVCFEYEGTQPVLRDVDLSVEAGRTVALVGPTGSGKTTLVTLIPRLYDVTRGAVLVDGADVRSVDPASLRREVAVVSDDAFLFSASLRDNIAYARPEAGDDEVVTAAERAGLGGLIDDLPDGLDTLVGERGLTLSGGQRQRVAIARALLAEPRILILDDATSSVDATTESQIKAALAEVMEGRTTFVIAHRLSTIALADEVVVIEDGRVAARGTHEELLDDSELYREIAEKGLPEQVFLTRAEVANL